MRITNTLRARLTPRDITRQVLLVGAAVMAVVSTAVPVITAPNIPAIMAVAVMAATVVAAVMVVAAVAEAVGHTEAVAVAVISTLIPPPHLAGFLATLATKVAEVVASARPQCKNCVAESLATSA